MQIIWDLIKGYWKTVILLPGHEVRHPNYVVNEEEEEDEYLVLYCNRPTYKITFFLSFLAVQNSSIGLIVRPSVPLSLCLSDPTNNQSLHNTTE